MLFPWRSVSRFLYLAFPLVVAFIIHHWTPLGFRQLTHSLTRSTLFIPVILLGLVQDVRKCGSGGRYRAVAQCERRRQCDTHQIELFPYN